MMNYYRILIIGLLSLILMSCNDEDVVNYSLDVDAYFQGVEINNKVVYAPVLIAKFNPEPVSLTATDINNDKYVLESYWSGKYSYRWIPLATDYLEKPTKENTFNFTAIFEDSEKNIQKSVSASLSGVPKPFKITEATYNPKESQLAVTWENAEADIYIIQLSNNLSEPPKFQSLNLIPESAEDEEATHLTATIDNNTLKWFSSPSVDSLYILSVHAFNLNNGNPDDIKGEFIATKKIIWGKKKK